MLVVRLVDHRLRPVVHLLQRVRLSNRQPPRHRAAPPGPLLLLRDRRDPLAERGKEPLAPNSLQMSCYPSI